MENDVDNNGLKYKCGPNWIPAWLFDEPVFNPCCKLHDIAYSEGTGKIRSDYALFKCCWRIARDYGWREKAQACVMYFVLLTNPLSYLWYYVCKIKK